jgi:hypothetical protein
MNIGYFSVQDSSHEDFIRWDILNKQEVVKQTKFFRHIYFKEAIKVIMDGKQKASAIMLNNNQ